MSNAFKEEGCEFLNEADCEERLEERGVKAEKSENEFYEDDEY